MNLTEFSKAKEKLNKQLRDGSITKQAHNRAMKKLTSSADAAKKGEFKNTSVGKFMKWLTTPAPLSEILGGRKTRKSTVNTAASEDIGAKPGAKPATKAKPAATRYKVKDRTKSKRKAPSFDPTLLKLPKSKQRKAPSFDPTLLKLPKSKPKSKAKTEEKRRYAIDVKTGKPKLDAPKVSDAVRLKQEDRYKTNKKIRDAATKSMKKKKG